DKDGDEAVHKKLKDNWINRVALESGLKSSNLDLLRKGGGTYFGCEVLRKRIIVGIHGTRGY
ncbi:hypothetical protein Tco_0510253, partial [Tanacetum coccineum]